MRGHEHAHAQAHTFMVRFDSRNSWYDCNLASAIWLALRSFRNLGGHRYSVSGCGVHSVLHGTTAARTSQREHARLAREPSPGRKALAVVSATGQQHAPRGVNTRYPTMMAANTWGHAQWS